MLSSRFRIYLSLFLCSFSVFLYEILIVRIFSVLYLYNVLFIMISLAILGLGLGGIFYQCYKSKAAKENVIPLEALILFPLSIDLTMMLINKYFYLFNIVISTLITLLPFFFGGIIMAAIYHNRTQDSSKLYFVDLLGGACACLLSLLAVQYLGVINSILLTGVISALAPLLLSGCLTPKKTNLVIPIMLTTLILVYSTLANPFNIGPAELAKTQTPLGAIMNYPRVKAVWYRASWDVYSRCDLVKTSKDDLQRSIYINGGTEAVMLKDQDDLDMLELFKYDLTFLPYLFNKNDSVLILGAGGGRDVRLALLAGAQDITAVEINQGVINMAKDEGAYNGYVYDNKNVKLAVEDARTFVMRDKNTYDRIILSLAYSYAFSDLSSIAQLENYLFTKEAFREYFDRLTDEGTLVIFVDYPELIEKFILTAVDYFNGQGVATPQAMQHITALATNYWSGYGYALIVKKTPFKLETSEAIQAKIKDIEIRPLHLPYYSGDNDFFRMAAGKLTLSEYIANNSNQLTPSTDNSPFFLEVAMNYRHKLVFLCVIMILLLLLVIMAYFIYIIRKQIDYPNASIKEYNLIKYFIPYFTIIGIGFMLVEISLTKRLSFYLGYPQLVLAVILFSILIGCGCGAMYSSIFKHNLAKRLSITSVILALLLVVMQLSLNTFIAYTVSYRLPVRCFLLACYLFPVSFFLGIPFPVGLRLLKLRLGEDISWFWGINGISTVIGSVLSVIIAMVWGFNVVFYGVAVCYLGIAAIAFALNKRGYESI